MSQHQRFHIKTLDELRALIAAQELAIPLADDLRILGSSVAIGKHTAWNRFAVHPMEGFDADENGTPGPLSFRRYTRYAAGGAALIWFEATAVVPEARSNPAQFWIHSGNVDVYKRLVDETRAAARRHFKCEPVLILQLTHSGRYSKPTGLPAPLIAHHSPVLDPIHRLPADYPLITDDYLDALRDRFADGAKLAAAAGFDGVDVKSCHRYLVSELLASHMRPGRYGGSFDNRTRLLRESLAAIRAAVPSLFVTTRMNAYDAISYPYGWGVNQDDLHTPDLTEPLKLVGHLVELGIPLLNVSIGNPYFNPHYGRPYDFPIQGMPAPAESPLAGMSRFLNITRQIQEAYPELPVVGSGYAWVRQFMPAIAAGVLSRKWATLIGQGRSSFAYPDAVKDILEKGAMDPDKCCVTCSACTQIMRDGGQTGCVVRDSEIYGPHYRQARRFSLDRLMEEAKRCRDCEQATCVRGCPARINIPGFIRAFAAGDIATAYALLKEHNLLPEMCGSVCPACEQCQGQCIERVFTDRPIAIQDIQLVVARTARLKGLTGVKLPAAASGRQIAVVGGGPAGLACAIRLLELGHLVTLWDRATELGGTPDAMIPEGRYGNTKAELQAVFKPALDAGRLTLQLGKSLGKDVTLATLRQAFSAVFVGVGLGEGTSLGQAEGVMQALEFLTHVKAHRLTQVPARVAILGAGNTAMDAALAAKHLGARDVYLVYRRSFAEMPAWAAERDAFLAAGGHVLTLSQPLKYITDGEGRLCGIRIARTELGEPDASGRRKPVVVPNSESTLAVTLAVEALGQGLDEHTGKALEGLPRAAGGGIALRPGSQQTLTDNVFAGGDLVNGGTTAVQAIVDGMKAAEQIDALLRV